MRLWLCVPFCVFVAMYPCASVFVCVFVCVSAYGSVCLRVSVYVSVSVGVSVCPYHCVCILARTGYQKIKVLALLTSFCLL